mmetsp:Transcript_11721/g.32960  ORF Transcript_11721/g.32960 Transcript_11721/m.32960 type:complete len:207 (-) Transcript_11721:1000-1620(-)
MIDGGQNKPLGVEFLINVGGDRLHGSVEFGFNAEEVVPVIVSDEVDSEAEVAEAAGPPDAVQIGFRVLGEVKVDDYVNGGDVDTAGKQVRRDEVAAGAVAEVMEYAVPVALGHPRVNKEAGVPHFGDLLGEEFHAGGGIAEDDGLVDVQLSEEGVEAVQFLALLDKGVVLGHALEGQVVHDVNVKGVGEVLVLKLLHGNREGRREH